MRTRIALAAIGPIAIITTTVLMQAVTTQPARGAPQPTRGATPTATTTAGNRQPWHSTNGRPSSATPAPTAARGPSLVLDLNTALLAHADGQARPVPAAAPAAPAVAPVPAVATAPAAAALPAGPVDTVTPAQRAAWERVALCEESGNWHADSARFSGGLGITRANWAIYGGTEFAPEGAMATEDQQIMVAERIQPNPPDRYGCTGW